MTATTLQQVEALPESYPIVPGGLAAPSRTVKADPSAPVSWPAKQSAAVLDFAVNWTASLAGDTIATSTVTLAVAAGLTIESDSHTTTGVTVWLSGGTIGSIATITNTVTTAGGRTLTLSVILPVADPALTGAAIWQRIEAYVAHRWTPRTVTWVVEGPGYWRAPLEPATISTSEIWSSADEWETVSLIPSPLGGYYLPWSGPFRFTATVGADNPPAEAVLEAARRLADYMSARPGKPGARSETVSAGSVTLTHSRSPSWMASALQNSGAADLLRGYRHV